MDAWIANEIRTADFGDERLDRRFGLLLGRLADKPSLSIPAACGGRAETEAAYRFFDNERVTPEKVLQPHRDATLQRVRAEKVVIVAQDTTELDLTRKSEKVGGPLNDTNRWGLFVHPLLVVTPQRVPLGVWQSEFWSRDAEEFARSPEEKRKERKEKPYEEKESARWREGYRGACVLAREAPETLVVCVSDSEGDIYECFLESEQQEGKTAEWIVRGCQDRAVQGSTAGLLATVAATPILGRQTIDVSKREASTGDGRKRQQARTARQATVTIQAARVELRPPHRADAKLPKVTVNIVLVQEENPPENEEPIQWLLVTTLPIDTFEAACEAITYYTCRWEIEVFFRVFKGGCRVEDLQLETEERLLVCAAVYMIVAWRVLYVLMLGRECPKMPCTAVLEEEEWKSVYVMVTKKKPPGKPPTLAEMIEMIASLGGHLGRKLDGPPGPKVMWIGLQRMRDFAAAWVAFGPARTPAGVV
jgi:hypothetical protein